MSIDASIEVKDEEQCCFVCGTLRGVDRNSRYLVAFDDKKGSKKIERYVKWHLVRERIPFDPKSPGFAIKEVRLSRQRRMTRAIAPAERESLSRECWRGALLRSRMCPSQKPHVSSLRATSSRS